MSNYESRSYGYQRDWYRSENGLYAGKRKQSNKVYERVRKQTDKMLSVWKDPFGLSTLHAKIPDGSCTLSAGVRLISSGELSCSPGLNYIALIPGVRSFVLTGVRSETDQNNLSVVTGCPGLVPGSSRESVQALPTIVDAGNRPLNSLGSYGHPATEVNEFIQVIRNTDQIYEPSQVDSIHKWRLVSMGLKLHLINPDDQNEGFWESIRISSAIDADDESCMANTLSLLFDGNVTFVDQPTYVAGRLRDLDKYVFQLKPDGLNFNFKKNTMLFDQGFDIIVIKIHGRGVTGSLKYTEVGNFTNGDILSDGPVRNDFIPRFGLPEIQNYISQCDPDSVVGYYFNRFRFADALGADPTDAEREAYNALIITNRIRFVRVWANIVGERVNGYGPDVHMTTVSVNPDWNEDQFTDGFKATVGGGGMRGDDLNRIVPLLCKMILYSIMVQWGTYDDVDDVPNPTDEVATYVKKFIVNDRYDILLGVLKRLAFEKYFHVAGAVQILFIEDRAGFLSQIVSNPDSTRIAMTVVSNQEIIYTEVEPLSRTHSESAYERSWNKVIHSRSVDVLSARRLRA